MKLNNEPTASPSADGVSIRWFELDRRADAYCRLWLETYRSDWGSVFAGAVHAGVNLEAGRWFTYARSDAISAERLYDFFDWDQLEHGGDLRLKHEKIAKEGSVFRWEASWLKEDPRAVAVGDGRATTWDGPGVDARVAAHGIAAWQVSGETLYVMTSERASAEGCEYQYRDVEFGTNNALVVLSQCDCQDVLPLDRIAHGSSSYIAEITRNAQALLLGVYDQCGIAVWLGPTMAVPAFISDELGP
ncbi:MAG: hypothetical protein KGJ62_14920 [Armatimonadetes bacterium]|nr:hypothetical protein [Armatimonadota bacterium]MDE2206170.1 hypothetical protein [Armatimonadota bacterium]